MLQFIYKNWLRNKTRLILMLIGLFVISSGLSYLVGLTEISKVKIDNSINSSTPPYHIVVRIKDTKNTTADNALLDINTLTGLNGGISKDQLKQIKGITDIEVAAPIVNYGNLLFNLSLDQINLDNLHLEDGVYRISSEILINNGDVDEQITRSITHYKQKGNKADIIGNSSYQFTGLSTSIRPNFLEYFSLIGIDPKEEAKLVGLDNAVSNLGNSHYFFEEDKTYIEDSNKHISMPILSNEKIFSNQKFLFKIERLDFLSNPEVKINKSFLDEADIDQNNSYFFTYSAEDVSSMVLESGKPLASNSSQSGLSLNSLLSSFTSYHQYKEKSSPFLESWQYAYGVDVIGNQQIPLNSFSVELNHTFKKINTNYKDNLIKIYPKWIGSYNSEKLKINKDPIYNQPIDIYRPAIAKLVLKANNSPINPPVIIDQNNNIFGFLNTPPQLLTTIDAAEKILGNKPISAIRIRVNGVDAVTLEGKNKIEKVAYEIEEQTGLEADIVYGATPEPTLIYIPENGDTKSLGWIEQIWMKLGETSLTIVKEFKTGYTGIFYIILLVPFIYIISTYYISYLARKKELALLLATGWKTSHLIKMIIIETFIMGFMLMVFSWGFLGVVTIQQNIYLTVTRFILIGIIAFIISLLSAILPSISVTRIKPYQALKTGEVKYIKKRLLRSKSIFMMAIINFLSRLERNILSVISIAIPTMLLIFILFVSKRLEGVLHTSWLGKYVAMVVGPIHYIAILITIGISIVTSVQIILQNTEERKGEIAIFKAIGWRSHSVRMLILYEGFIIGVLSVILGFFLSFLIILNVYHKFPINDMYIYFVSLAPLIIGTLSSLYPAEKAARQHPLISINGINSITRTSSKILSYSLGFIILITTIFASISIYYVILNSIKFNENQLKVEKTIMTQSSKELTSVGNLESYNPKYVSNFSRGNYNIDLKMDHQGNFTVNAKIQVENNSHNKWDEVVFYFIPNVFTKENQKRTGTLSSIESTEVKIISVKVDGEETKYTLNYDTLEVIKSMESNSKHTIEISYNFTVPLEGNIRFYTDQKNYYLGQWYPMLATYREGKWNKEYYQSYTESYHTDFSNFTIRYEIPKEYIIVSSAVDPISNNSSGILKASNIKEVFIGILKKPKEKSQLVDGIEIRVFSQNEEGLNKALQSAVDAVKYYNHKIGTYPYKQLDVITVGGMEYPGIIMANIEIEETIPHEIGHQWFYGVVSNDPYYHGWLDEGLTELLTSIYFYDEKNKSQEESFKFIARKSRVDSNKPIYSNLSIDNYKGQIKSILYDQPVIRLWKLFTDFGGTATAREFLRAYYSKYAFKEIDTEEFVRFTKAYFNLKDDQYFQEWLKIK